MFERVRTVPFAQESGESAIMYSPEDVILYKLKYFNEGRMPKHPRDILAILETHQQMIELDYISYWARETGVEPI